MTEKSWKPIEFDELIKLIQGELGDCPSELVAVFERYKVQPYRASIKRFGGKSDQVFIAARRGHEVMYFEDVEEGWNFSPIDEDGHILEHWCNQDELKYALRRWVDTVS